MLKKLVLNNHYVLFGSKRNPRYFYTQGTMTETDFMSFEKIKYPSLTNKRKKKRVGVKGVNVESKSKDKGNKSKRGVRQDMNNLN